MFYCVANMPGAVPHTSTYALTNVTLPYALELANRGWRDAVRADPARLRSLMRDLLAAQRAVLAPTAAALSTGR